MDVGGGHVAETLDAVSGVAHRHGRARGLEHRGVVVAVANRDCVGDAVAEVLRHIAQGRALVDAVDEQLAVVGRNIIVRAVNQREPLPQVTRYVIKTHIGIRSGEIRSLARMDDMPQRGTIRHLDVAL